jgi:hypothetical protein
VRSLKIAANSRGGVADGQNDKNRPVLPYSPR